MLRAPSILDWDLDRHLGDAVKFFGHHVTLPALILAILEGGLFLLALYFLGLTGPCEECYFASIAHLKAHEAVLLTLGFILISTSVGLYNTDALLHFRVFVSRFLLASQLVFIPAVVVVGIVKAAAGLPFGWYIGILSVVIGGFFLVLFLIRVALFWWIDLPFLKKRVIVLGNGSLAERVCGFIDTHGSSHLRCVKRIANGRLATRPQFAHGNVALEADVSTQPVPLALIAQTLRTDEIVVAVDDKRGLPIWQLLECKVQGIEVTDYLAFWERETGQIDLHHAGAGWLALSEGFRINKPRRAVKRLIDIVVSFSFLVLTLPLMLVIALAIKCDSKGPIFYRQERVGPDGRVFRIWKFRSMRVDAEHDGVPIWASQGDDRVTHVGHFMRNTRIDEIPQVVNVLMGDMSFIGPRPERPHFVELLRKKIPFYDLRHRVRPGITGWAQVHYPYGSSVDDAKRKLAYDLYYVKNNDTLLDLAILIQTVRVILFQHGGR